MRMPIVRIDRAGYFEYRLSYEGVAAKRRTGKWTSDTVNEQGRWCYKDAGVWL
jgi:hypothetical protein